jgi:hypothetical protein
MKTVKIIENGMENVENMPQKLNRGAVIQINSIRTDSDSRHTPVAYILCQTDTERYQLISAVDGNRWGKPFSSKGLLIDSDNLIKHIGENTNPPIVWEVCYISKNIQEMYQSIAQKAIDCIKQM